MNILEKIYKKTLQIFGDIKVFPWPMFILYHPEGYKMKGEDVREVLNTIKPGDVLLRGYLRYIDGYFIPGTFSHAGMYVGENKVIHSMAEGIFKEDVINFCRCDMIAIMRVRGITDVEINQACIKAKVLIGTKYDFEFESGDDELYCTEAVVKFLEHLDLEIEKTTTSILFGLISKTYYQPDTFYYSDNFTCEYINQFTKNKIINEGVK